VLDAPTDRAVECKHENAGGLPVRSGVRSCECGGLFLHLLVGDYSITWKINRKLGGPDSAGRIHRPWKDTVKVQVECPFDSGLGH
jgi:hypothetical protein